MQYTFNSIQDQLNYCGELGYYLHSFNSIQDQH